MIARIRTILPLRYSLQLKTKLDCLRLSCHVRPLSVPAKTVHGTTTILKRTKTLIIAKWSFHKTMIMLTSIEASRFQASLSSVWKTTWVRLMLRSPLYRQTDLREHQLSHHSVRQKKISAPNLQAVVGQWTNWQLKTLMTMPHCHTSVQPLSKKTKSKRWTSVFSWVNRETKSCQREHLREAPIK